MRLHFFLIYGLILQMHQYFLYLVIVVFFGLLALKHGGVRDRKRRIGARFALLR